MASWLWLSSALVLASASINLILTKQEKSRFAPYGQRVSVDGGNVNVWRNGHAGPTMVLLSGLGTAAPALDFAPLIRQLGDYNVFVVEGFGYGYSDMSARPRTVQNITTEIHDVLSKLGAPKPYILVGHSIAGFYTLSYAHRYPQEVSAVVGIDPTVPASKAGAAGTSGLPFHALGTILRMSGLVRAAITLSPGLAEPKGDAYTPDERAHIRAMSIWNFGNAAVSDETNRMGSNAAALRGVTYPDRLPVLDFLASEKGGNRPGLGATARGPAAQRPATRDRRARRRALPALDAGQGDGRQDHRLPRTRRAGSRFTARLRRRHEPKSRVRPELPIQH